MSITLTFSGGQTNESNEEYGYVVITCSPLCSGPRTKRTFNTGFMGAEKSRLVRDDVLKGC